MTDREALLILIDALLRKDTEQDGNWGWPSFTAELRYLQERLSPAAGDCLGEKK